MNPSNTFRMIRYWSFPVGLALAWIVTTGYTLTALSKLPIGRTATQRVSRAAST